MEYEKKTLLRMRVGGQRERLLQGEFDYSLLIVTPVLSGLIKVLKVLESLGKVKSFFKILNIWEH